MAKGRNAQLSGGRELSRLTQNDPLTGSLLQKLITAVNVLAANSAVSATGKLSPPPPIDTHNVQGTYDADTNTLTVPGEVLHYTMVHNQAIQKGVQYVSEIATDPSFSSPHPIDHGASRSAFVSLPTFQDDGVTPQTYYLRSLPQYHGSDPQKPTVFGGLNGPTKIVMGGTSSGSLLPGQGSGTARNGQQGAQGLGKVLNRPSPGPKRNIIMRSTK